MKIFDLTKGKYPSVPAGFAQIVEDTIMQRMEELRYPNKNFLYHRFGTNLWDDNLWAVLQEIPVFIVDTDMSGKSIVIPDTGVTIEVPEDHWKEYVKIESDPTIKEGTIEVPEDHWKEDVKIESDPTIKEWFHKKRRELEEDERDERDERDEKRYEEKDERDEKRYEEKENANKRNKNRNGSGIAFTIYDYLGVYIYTSENDILPRRIFVWANKIEKAAQGDSVNATALFRKVVFHEIGHALMDTPLYFATPDKRFSYSDYVYKYIEEACANAFALAMDFDYYTPTQQQFIRNFINSQPDGYNQGIKIFESHRFPDIFNSWLTIKVAFRMCLDSLYEFWCLSKRHYWDMLHAELDVRHPHRKEALALFSTIFYQEGSDMGSVASPSHLLLGGRGDKIMAFSDDWGKTFGILDETGNVIVPAQYNDIRIDNKLGNKKFWAQKGDKWGLLDTNGNQYTPYKYDSVWSFDKDGLCMVRIDDPTGYKYGYVNKYGYEQIPIVYEDISSFHKGRTIAELGGKYYIIDSNNNILFDLSTIDTWNDVRGFNQYGIAYAENSFGKWGCIDYNGNLKYPCQYSKITDCPNK